METTTIQQPAQTAVENLVPSAAQDFFARLESIKAKPLAGETQLVEKHLSTVTIRKSTGEVFMQTHPTAKVDACVLNLKAEGEKTLLVANHLQSALAGEQCVSVQRLQLAVTIAGDPFILRLRFPSESRTDHWATSAMEAATLAQGKWVRMTANMALGGYQIATAKIENEPVWPTIPFEEILRIAFKGSYIDNLEHPVLKKLRGEA